MEDGEKMLGQVQDKTLTGFTTDYPHAYTIDENGVMKIKSLE